MDPRRVDRRSHGDRQHQQDLAEAEITLEGLTDNFEDWHDLPYDAQIETINDATRSVESHGIDRLAKVIHALRSQYVTADPADPSKRTISGGELVDQVLDPSNTNLDED
jgi:hypothetical protein